MTKRWMLLGDGGGSSGASYPPLDLTTAYFREDFLGGRSSQTGSSSDEPLHAIGEHHWSHRRSAGADASTGILQGGTQAFPSNPGVVQFNIAAQDDRIVLMAPADFSNAAVGAFDSRYAFTMRWIFEGIRATGNQRLCRVGFVEAGSGIDEDPPYGGYVRFGQTADTNYVFQTFKSTTDDEEDSGVAVPTATAAMKLLTITHAFEGNTLSMQINGGSPVSVPFYSSGWPIIQPFADATLLGSTVPTNVLNLDYCDYRVTGLTRYA